MELGSAAEELRKVLLALKLDTEALSCSLFSERGLLVGVGAQDGSALSSRMARLTISVDSVFKDAGLGGVQLLLIAGQFGSVAVSKVEDTYYSAYLCLTLPKGATLGLAALALDAVQPELKRRLANVVRGKQRIEVEGGRS